MLLPVVLQVGEVVGLAAVRGAPNMRAECGFEAGHVDALPQPLRVFDEFVGEDALS